MTPVEVTIRRGTGDDVATLARMRQAWTEEYVGESVEDEGFLAALEDWYAREEHQRVTWLADVSRAPVGMLNMLVFTRMPRPRRGTDDRPSQWGYVANVFVDEPYRGAGVGRLLLDAAVEHAEAAGFARIVLSPSERSVPFYLRAGFVPATSLMIREL